MLFCLPVLLSATIAHDTIDSVWFIDPQAVSQLSRCGRYFYWFCSPPCLHAPKARAISGVRSTEPVSTTIISSTQGRMLVKQASRIRSLSRTIMHRESFGAMPGPLSYKGSRIMENGRRTRPFDRFRPRFTLRGRTARPAAPSPACGWL